MPKDDGCPAGVVAKLLDEGVERIEALLVAQPAAEHDVDVGVVEVGIEVEQVRFD
ncbi:MAG: hypothetical protein JWL72_1714, partial [Ilumatobacteraceae bacterium]|nr:hypothetical protein [Ilumatobacteraceae bacterium]